MWVRLVRQLQLKTRPLAASRLSPTPFGTVCAAFAPVRPIASLLSATASPSGGSDETRRQRGKKKTATASPQRGKGESTTSGRCRAQRDAMEPKTWREVEDKAGDFDADEMKEGEGKEGRRPWYEEEEGHALIDEDDDLDGAGEVVPRARPLGLETVVEEECHGGEGPDDDEVTVSKGGGADGGNEPVPLADEESRYLKDRFPDLAAEYDQDLNGEPVDEVMVDSARVVSWKCLECNFKWKSGVFVRTCLRTKCPQCEQLRNPRLSARFVQLWDDSLNDPCVDPKTVAASSNKSAYWRCSNCGTSFQARIKDMVSDKAKCPSCSMLNLHADFSKYENGLLQEWHPLKNGDRQPDQVEPADQTKLWWLCMACGHEWEATLAARLSKSRRTKGKDCPVCHGKGRG